MYSHEIIFNWLQEILPAWEIHIPESGVCALSEWPKNKKSRNSVKQWLQEKNFRNPDDLIDGACEPLVYHLSFKMSQNQTIGLRKQYEVRVHTVLGSTSVRTFLRALSVWTLSQ